MTYESSRVILTLPYQPGEVMHSVMSRLAMIKGGNAARFAFDQGIRFVELVDGNRMLCFDFQSYLD